MSDDISLLKVNLDKVNNLGSYMSDYLNQYNEVFRIPTFNFNELSTNTINTVKDSAESYQSKLLAVFVSLFVSLIIITLVGGGMFVLNMIAIKKTEMKYAGITFIAFLTLSFFAIVAFGCINSLEFHLFDYCESILDITDKNEIP